MKYAAEQHLKASGASWTIVRATAFLELWIDVLTKTAARSGLPVVFGHGNNPVNFVSVTDVAALVEHAITSQQCVAGSSKSEAPLTTPSISWPPHSRQPPGAPPPHATCPRPSCGSWPAPSAASNPDCAPSGRRARHGPRRPHRAAQAGTRRPS